MATPFASPLREMAVSARLTWHQNRLNDLIKRGRALGVEVEYKQPHYILRCHGRTVTTSNYKKAWDQIITFSNSGRDIFR